MSIERIVEGLERREPAALARAISLVENQRDGFERLLSHVHPGLGRGAARRIGVTGPPGAGKSTLTERLIQRFRAQELTVGVVAVDPTSPFTGGGRRRAPPPGGGGRPGPPRGLPVPGTPPGG